MRLALVAQYNDPVGAILFWFGLFVAACLALAFWGWSRAFGTLRDQRRDQQQRQDARDEIDARTLRGLREEQDRGPRSGAQAPPRQRLPRWGEAADQYESRRRRRPEDGGTTPESTGAGNPASRGGAAGEGADQPAGGGVPGPTRRRHCTSCGARAREQDRFCAACGDELASA